MGGAWGDGYSLGAPVLEGEKTIFREKSEGRVGGLMRRGKVLIEEKWAAEVG